jgi:predicted negative regulator of RcsB-dependent stress response
LTEYLTEQEQIQQLKTWVKQYGLTILTGILLAVALSTGWRYYQNYQNKALLHASAVYDEMLTLRAQNNADGAIVQAKKLLRNYPKSPYAQMAAFMLARDAVIKKDYPEAVTQLNWVVDHSKNHSIQEIAQIRIARIQINDKKPADALATLKKLNDKNFIGMVDEVRGDAYVAMNDNSSARKAYELALQEIPNAEVTRPILEMKYDNLAEAPAKG